MIESVASTESTLKITNIYQTIKSMKKLHVYLIFLKTKWKSIIFNLCAFCNTNKFALVSQLFKFLLILA